MKAKLSMAFQDLRGKDGNVVISMRRSGLTLTPRTNPRNPKTAAQRSVRANLSKASRTFKAFTPTQAAAWNAYGNTLVRHNPISGETYTSSGINAFTELATKMLQINPIATLPTAPPSTPFTGDSITITASATTGKVTFTASGANATLVSTEVLLQPLPSQNRKPSPDGYVSKGFIAFAVGSLSLDVLVPAGYYAAAYRFVRPLTGQTTDLISLPIQTVTMSMEMGDSAPAPSKKRAA